MVEIVLHHRRRLPAEVKEIKVTDHRREIARQEVKTMVAQQRIVVHRVIIVPIAPQAVTIIKVATTLRDVRQMVVIITQVVNRLQVDIMRPVVLLRHAPIVRRIMSIIVRHLLRHSAHIMAVRS